MKELDRIVDILCNYYACRQVDPNDEEMLCNWLNESQANENLLTELSDDACWIKNTPACNVHDLIRSRLIQLYKK